MKKISQMLKSLIALIIGVILAIVISEIFLQIFDFPQRPVCGWLSCKKIHPEQCNSMGFRGIDIAYSDEDFVVVLLGDSEVYAASSLFEQIPERRLEHYLRKIRKNVKVFTIADMGYGQDQQYLALKKYFQKYRADLVLLMFTARNDIENNIYPTSGKNNTIKPTYWLRNNELLGPNEEWLEPRVSRLKLALLWQIYFGHNDGESRNKTWEEKILPPYAKPPDQPQVDMNDSLHQDNSHEMYLMGILTLRNERVQYGINLTRKLFSKINELTETNNGHFIIFKEERPIELINLINEETYFLNGKSYKKSMKQYQDNLNALFRGFEHYRIPLNMDNYISSPDDIHLNAQAINKLMEELSLIISRRDYFK